MKMRQRGSRDKLWGAIGEEKDSGRGGGRERGNERGREKESEGRKDKD